MAKYNEMGFIEELDDGEVFVFGNNSAAAHMGGAAAMAVAKSEANFCYGNLAVHFVNT